MTRAQRRPDARIRGYLWALVIGVSSAPAALGQVDARELMRQAVAADECNWRVARNYTFRQRVELRHLDGKGRLKASAAETYDVRLQEGTPYQVLVQRDDRPLTAAEEKKEQSNLVESMAERRKESEREHLKRLSVYERRPDWQREAWSELAEAFDFQLVREDETLGRRTYVIDAVPRPGYQARSHTARLFRSMKGRFWVDRQDHQMVKAEVEAAESFYVGFFLVRVLKGSRATLELTNVSEGVWMPDQLRVFASARVGLLVPLHIEQSIAYSRYSSTTAEAAKLRLAEGRDVSGSGQGPLGKATAP